jgi:hypothetical protein
MTESCRKDEAVLDPVGMKHDDSIFSHIDDLALVWRDEPTSYDLLFVISIPYSYNIFWN